jgi:hypothetical protein
MRCEALLIAALSGCGGSVVMSGDADEAGESSSEASGQPSDDGPGATSTSGGVDPSSTGEGSSSGSGVAESLSSDASESSTAPACLVEGSGFPCADVLAFAPMCDATHPDARGHCFGALALLFGADLETGSLAMTAYDCDGCEAETECSALVGEPVCARWSHETAIECAAPILEQAGPNASSYVCDQLG